MTSPLTTGFDQGTTVFTRGVPVGEGVEAELDGEEQREEEVHVVQVDLPRKPEYWSKPECWSKSRIMVKITNIGQMNTGRKHEWCPNPEYWSKA